MDPTTDTNATCPACGGRTVPFRVPPALEGDAPAPVSAVCIDCLRVHAAEQIGFDPARTATLPEPDRTDFSPVSSAIPTGAGAVAFVLALGKLGSLAVNRPAIIDLLADAESAGVDTRLTLERLETDCPDAHFDIGRRTRQIDDFW